MKRSNVRSGIALRCLLAATLMLGLVSAAQLAAVPHAGQARADTATGSAGLFVPAVGRLLDTRNGTGGYSTPMPAGGVRTVTATGRAGIPASGVSALALTLTAVGAGTIGAVSVAPGDVATPSGAALVFNPGDSISNTALLALHADGTLHVLADHAVNLIIDVQGYFTAGPATAPGGFVPVDQFRLVDTRSGLGTQQAKVTTGGAITVQPGGAAGVPADASVVYANITVLNQSANGYLRTYPADQPAPSTGALDFDDSATAQSVAIPLSADGKFKVLVGAGGPVDLVVDIQGYFTAADSDATFTPAAVHLLDTRAAPVRTLAGNSVTQISIAGVSGIPAVADGLGAVALNLRTVRAATSTTGGYLKLWPSDRTEPSVSNVDYTTQNIYRTDLAIIAPAADGSIKIRNGGSGPVDLVIDVEGWFAAHTPPAPLIYSPQYPQDLTTNAAASAATFHVSAGYDAQAAITRFEWTLDGSSVSSVSAARDDDLLVASVAPAAAQASAPGPHRLQVTSVDQRGHRSTATSYAWTVGQPGVDLGQPPSPPVVSSPTYREDVWSPIAATALFNVSADNQDPPVTSITYALDDAVEATVAASTAQLTLDSPTTPGPHVLHVAALNAQGYNSYDYAFYLGATPDPVSSVRVTPGQGSALISWPAATIASGSVTSYDVQLVDTGSGAATDIGSCDTCTAMAVSGIGSTAAYTARLTASSAAGPSASTSSTSFTGLAAGSAASCDSTGTCTTTNAGCLLATCDTAGIDGQPSYSATYLAADGSSARAAANGTAYLVTRAGDGTAGTAGDMVLSGSLNLSVTSTSTAEPAGIGTPEPAAKTPDGYRLRGNNRIDEYHYRSENGLMTVTKTIRGDKYLVGAVKVQMRQTLNGGDSHRWKIEVRASWAGGDPYDFYYAYNCGINVPKDDDWTCNTHEADADGTWDDDLVHGCYGSVSEIHDASFGSTEPRYAKFPLVAYRITYRDGGYRLRDYLYYRGWDVRKVGTPWVMANVTGTGW